MTENAATAEEANTEPVVEKKKVEKGEKPLPIDKETGLPMPPELAALDDDVELDDEGSELPTLGELGRLLPLGYRDGEGAGRSFIGTLGPSWEQLSAAEQRAEAERLVQALHSTGVHEVMAFDAARRLEIQGARGVLRIPKS